METFAILAAISSLGGLIAIGVWVGSISSRVTERENSHKECRSEMSESLKEIYRCLKSNAGDLNKIKGKMGID